MTKDDTHSRDRQGLSEEERALRRLADQAYFTAEGDPGRRRVVADRDTVAAGLAARGGNTDNTLRAAAWDEAVAWMAYAGQGDVKGWLLEAAEQENPYRDAAPAPTEEADQ